MLGFYSAHYQSANPCKLCICPLSVLVFSSKFRWTRRLIGMLQMLLVSAAAAAAHLSHFQLLLIFVLLSHFISFFLLISTTHNLIL